MDQYFFEVFENIPRQGPGMNSSTRKAFNVIHHLLPEQPEILDIGCGKGVQTLELARLSEGSITALDNRPFFLSCLRNDAAAQGYSERIRCIEADMKEMNFGETKFDLIWAEGSVFIIGIREGLKQWKRFLKSGGIMVFSDLVWLTDSRPEDLNAYMEEECQYVLTIDEVLSEARKNDYTCIKHFTLPDEGWTEAYFRPQQEIINKMRVKYKDSEEARKTFDALEFEREMISRSLQYVGYEFFMLQI